MVVKATRSISEYELLKGQTLEACEKGEHGRGRICILPHVPKIREREFEPRRVWLADHEIEAVK